MNELYTTEFCLNRLYEKLEGDKPGVKKFTSKKPLISIQNKKTIICNFAELCQTFKRDPNDVESFIKTTLKVATSISGTDGSLLINNMYKQLQIDEVILKYMKTYVICSQKGCGSGNTVIQKENRLTYLKCNNCGSGASITE